MVAAISLQLLRRNDDRYRFERFEFNAVPSSVQNIVLGIIILLAVGIDMWRAEFLRFFLEGKERPGHIHENPIF